MTNTTTSKTSSKFAFTFDHVSKAIVGTDVNFQKAGIPGSKQEEELMARIDAHPTYSFKVIETEKKPAKKTYKGLTSELMKEYISIQAEEKQAELMAQFNNMVEDKMAYPTIKSWFLDEFKNFSVSKAKSQIKNHKLVSAKAKVRLVKASASKTNEQTEGPVAAAIASKNSNQAKAPANQNTELSLVG